MPAIQQCTVPIVPGLLDHIKNATVFHMKRCHGFLWLQVCCYAELSMTQSHTSMKREGDMKNKKNMSYDLFSNWTLNSETCPSVTKVRLHKINFVSIPEQQYISLFTL